MKVKLPWKIFYLLEDITDFKGKALLEVQHEHIDYYIIVLGILV